MDFRKILVLNRFKFELLKIKNSKSGKNTRF